MNGTTCRVRSIIAVVAALGLVAALARAQPGPAAPPREPGAGLLFYAKGNYATNTTPIANPHIVGAFFQIIWSEIEKEPGKCDWTEVDKWIAPWLAAGKKVALRVMWSTSGYWTYDYYKHPTPQWVWAAGAKFAYHAPSKTEIPLIWDPVYRQHAANFMREVNRKYGANPNVLFIDLTPGAETNPYRFGTINRTDPGFKGRYLATPASDGRPYSQELWDATLRGWFDDIAGIFKECPVLVTLNTAGLEGPDRAAQVGDECVARGFYVGQNGLRGGSYAEDGARRRGFAKWGARTRLFFEMVDDTGARTGTLDEVIDAAQRIQCNYLNVYPEQVLRGTPGHPQYSEEFAGALRRGAGIIGRPVVVSSGVDTVLGQRVFTYEQKEDLARLETELRRARLGPERRGRFVHYFQADTDGSIQPVGMFVPEDYVTARAWPLVIQLHGMGPKRIAGTRADWPGMQEADWVDRRHGVIYAQAYARQNASYRGIAEAEVLQIVRLVQQAYHIDPDRIYLMGHSMGGGGTLQLALHHPDLFAGVIPIDASTRGVGRPTEGTPAWRVEAEAVYDTMRHAGNALNLPLRMHTADSDLRADQEALFATMQAAGNRDTTIKVHQGMPHNFSTQVPYHTFIPEVLPLRREARPARVRFTTGTLRYAQAYWAAIESFEQAGRLASLDAAWQGPVLAVRTENVDRFRLDLRGAPAGARIEIGGAMVTVPAGAAELTLVKAGAGAWRPTGEPLARNVKRPALPGGIGDAFMSPFLLVYGDDRDLQLAHAEADAIRNPAGERSCIVGDYPFKAWHEVTATDIAGRNLILFGTAYSNPLIRELQAQLPIQVTDYCVKAGIEEYPGSATVFAAPNPRNPDRYVVVWSGPLFSQPRGIANLGTGLRLESLPDYITFDGGALVRAGWFDEHWKLPPSPGPSAR